MTKSNAAIPGSTSCFCFKSIWDDHPGCGRGDRKLTPSAVEGSKGEESLEESSLYSPQLLIVRSPDGFTAKFEKFIYSF